MTPEQVVAIVEDLEAALAAGEDKLNGIRVEIDGKEAVVAVMRPEVWDGAKEIFAAVALRNKEPKTWASKPSGSFAKSRR